MRYYTVYRTTNTVNGKTYVGLHQTDDLEDGYLGSGKIFMRALKRYGRQAFVKEILHVFSTEQEMIEKERELVTEDFCVSDDTYNIKLGGVRGAPTGNTYWLGRSHSQETRDKMSARLQQYNPLRGRTLPASTKQKMSVARVGKPRSEATKQKLRETHKGRQFTLETREKMAAAKRGTKRGPHSEETRLKISNAIKAHRCQSS